MSGKCVVALATGEDSGVAVHLQGADTQFLVWVWEMTGRSCHLWLLEAQRVRIPGFGEVWPRAFV